MDLRISPNCGFTGTRTCLAIMSYLILGSSAILADILVRIVVPGSGESWLSASAENSGVGREASGRDSRIEKPNPVSESVAALPRLQIAFQQGLAPTTHRTPRSLVTVPHAVQIPVDTNTDTRSPGRTRKCQVLIRSGDQ